MWVRVTVNFLIRGGTDNETGGSESEGQQLRNDGHVRVIPRWRGTCWDSGCRHMDLHRPIKIKLLFLYVWNSLMITEGSAAAFGGSQSLFVVWNPPKRLFIYFKNFIKLHPCMSSMTRRLTNDISTPYDFTWALYGWYRGKEVWRWPVRKWQRYLSRHVRCVPRGVWLKIEIKLN